MKARVRLPASDGLKSERSELAYRFERSEAARSTKAATHEPKSGSGKRPARSPSAAHPLICPVRWRTRNGGRGNAGPFRATYDSSDLANGGHLPLSTIHPPNNNGGDGV